MSAVGRISGLRAPKSPLSAQAFSQRLKKNSSGVRTRDIERKNSAIDRCSKGALSAGFFNILCIH